MATRYVIEELERLFPDNPAARRRMVVDVGVQLSRVLQLMDKRPGRLFPQVETTPGRLHIGWMVGWRRASVRLGGNVEGMASRLYLGAPNEYPELAGASAFTVVSTMVASRRVIDAAQQQIIEWVHGREPAQRINVSRLELYDGLPVPPEELNTLYTTDEIIHDLGTFALRHRMVDEMCLMVRELAPHE